MKNFSIEAVAAGMSFAGKYTVSLIIGFYNGPVVAYAYNFLVKLTNFTLLFL